MSFCALLESDDDFDMARYEAIHAGVPAFPGVRGRTGIVEAGGELRVPIAQQEHLGHDASEAGGLASQAGWTALAYNLDTVADLS